MMKKFIRILCVTMILPITKPFTSHAADFVITTSISTSAITDCYPVVNGTQIKLTVYVKSYKKGKNTISINKSLTFPTRESWVQITNNSKDIDSSQTVSFDLTITPPNYTNDGNYTFSLTFDASPSGSFGGHTLKVYVDNSVPEILDLSIFRSTSLYTDVNWDAYDTWSNDYTYSHPSAGVGGIKKYEVVLKNSDGTITIKNQPYIAPDFFPKFTSFTTSPNTNYKVFVTATDLAGNSKTSQGLSFITAPAAPTNLASNSTGYCSTTLTWTASVGATSYNIYYTTTTVTKLGTTSSTSYPVTGLSNGTTSKFFVTAVNNGGESNQSNNLSVTTISLPTPIITGPSAVCTSTVTLTASNLPTGCSVSWDDFTNLTPLATFGNTAIFTIGVNGQCSARATYNSGCGSRSNHYYFNAGIPLLGYIALTNPVGGEGYWCSSHYGNTFSTESSDPNATYEAQLLSWPDRYVERSITTVSPGVDPFGYVPEAWYIFQLRATNGCGSSDWSESEVEYLDCNNYSPQSFSVLASPNPTSGDLNITIEKEKPEVKALDKSEKVKYILYDLNRTQVVKSWQFDNSQNQQYINVRGIKAGQYILIVTKGKFRQSTQIIIQ